MEEYTYYIQQAIIPLSSGTLKDDFIHMDGKIRYFTDLNKWTFPLDIVRRRGKDIIKEVAIKIA